MGRRKGKSNGHFDRLAELKEETPILSALEADQLAIEEAVNAFLTSATADTFGQVIGLTRQAEELKITVRTISRQKEEVDKQLSLAKREKDLKQDHLRRVNEQKIALKANAKNSFLKHPKIAEFKAMIMALGKNFTQATDEWVLKGLASDARYSGLEAEGLLVNASAEKLMRQIASLEKKQGTLERKITRLQAEVGKLELAAKTQKAGIYGPSQI